jgi:hypothetical protein
MTTTINVEWAQPDEREDKREDSAWYTYGNGHDLVAYVMKGEREIAIYADGEMNISVMEKSDNGYSEMGRIRYSDDLPQYGITEDDDLWGLEPVLDEYDLSGPNKAGFYFRIHHNSWFDLYESQDGEHLDAVCHTLTEAIAEATKIVSDDGDV